MPDDPAEEAMMRVARKVMGRRIAKSELHTFLEAIAVTPNEIDRRQRKKLIRRFVNAQRHPSNQDTTGR
jgi:hypothetical protein